MKTGAEVHPALPLRVLANAGPHPSFPTPPTCHPKRSKAKPRILVVLLSLPFHFTTEKNESPPPLSLPPLRGGRLGWGCTLPLSPQIARPREDGDGNPARLPSCVLAHAGTHPTFFRRQPLTPSTANGSREFSSSSSPSHSISPQKRTNPLPLFSFPLQGGRLGWGCTLPCPRK